LSSGLPDFVVIEDTGGGLSFGLSAGLAEFVLLDEQGDGGVLGVCMGDGLEAPVFQGELAVVCRALAELLHVFGRHKVVDLEVLFAIFADPQWVYLHDTDLQCLVLWLGIALEELQQHLFHGIFPRGLLLINPVGS
jgi:hypothetical protein